MEEPEVQKWKNPRLIPAAATAKAIARNARLAQQEGKGKGSKKNYLSAAGIIEKAHGFFYDLITRQGENNGVLTFDYDSKTKSGEPVSAKNKSVITSVKKIAGGGGGLPSNYFFGGFLDHQIRVQSIMTANVTTANVFKTYSDARDGANIQSFTEAAIKAINLGSPPDYTDALGSWEQQAPADANEQRGGDGESQDSDFGSDASSVAPGSNTTLASRGDEDPTGMNRLTDKRQLCVQANVCSRRCTEVCYTVASHIRVEQSVSCFQLARETSSTLSRLNQQPSVMTLPPRNCKPLLSYMTKASSHVKSYWNESRQSRHPATITSTGSLTSGLER